jgi:predicted ribosome quality control (RQC) complex YloA/Tae2 family protein
LSDGGYEILIGRNNRQNDELTFRLARKDDLWLHVKDYPGSHVIIRCRGGQPDEQTVALAAALAAEHSRAGGQAAVDVTQVRYVKKSPGAKPGMVTYSNHYTVITGNPRQAP